MMAADFIARSYAVAGATNERTNRDGSDPSRSVWWVWWWWVHLGFFRSGRSLAEFKASTYAEAEHGTVRGRTVSLEFLPREELARHHSPPV